MIASAPLLLTLAQADAAEGQSWLDTIQAGGVIGYIIIGLSLVGLALVIMHLVQIRRSALIPPAAVEELDRLLARGDVPAALQFCLDPKNDSYLTRIMAAGLTRFQKSAFGAFEIKNAIEEAGEDQTARLYRSTDALGVIGTIAPLLGLLGTVQGMVGAFGTLSHSAAPSHEQLASNISLALVTTLLGLIVAIPAIVVFSYFRNRIDTLASEAGMEIEQLVLRLESAPTGGPMPVAPARPQPALRPAPPAASARPPAAESRSP